ncbi:uncharacterized protein LOC141495872 [Macrotis lagotis]|uniref:uncharacterized protein LOC141495872 n=1 Tax=Macrotis lagotis TaxID=92651 RepID=UPI003D688AC4
MMSLAQPAHELRAWRWCSSSGLVERGEAAEKMSLTKEQPAPLAAYGQLGQGKTPERCAEPSLCMDAPGNFSKTGYEWQRTEGKLQEIGLNVNAGGQLQEGLGKSAGFPDQGRLCFFEGKLDKEPAREKEAPGERCSAAPGHLQSWSLISENFPPSQGNLTNQKTSESTPGQAMGSGTKPQPGGQPPDTSSGPAQYIKEEETSVWNPNFNPVPQEALGSGEKEPRAPSQDGFVTGVVNDNYGLSSYSSLITPTPAPSETPLPDPPITMVELAQEDLKESFSGGYDEEGSSVDLEKPSHIEGAFLNRTSKQRKAIRRAMSECSHLSVPLVLNLADKYPGSPDQGDHSPILLSPTSVPGLSPTARKPRTSSMKRSLTVAEEQTATPGLSLGESPSQTTKELFPLIQEPAAQKEELVQPGQTSSGKREPLNKLEQIPEVSIREKGQEGAEERGFAGPPAAQKEIEVISTQCAPSFQRREEPRDGMLLNFTSMGNQQIAVKRTELTDCRGGVGD